jgi:hypothetical protein
LRTQTAFCKRFQGIWAGERSSNELVGEHVKSVWELTLDGNFLRESWYTSGDKETLELNAIAFFRVVGGSPSEFFVAYRSGRMATGRSELRNGEWRLFHEGFRQPTELNEIRIRFEGDDKYSQEVRELGPRGDSKLVNHATLTRQREFGIREARRELFHQHNHRRLHERSG